MTALTVASQNATTTTPQAGLVLTGPLKCWLLDERSDAVAIDTIRKSPILTEQTRNMLPALRSEALKPATQEQIKAVISQRFALFPQSRRNEQEWAAWWADYFDALDGLTPFAIEAGMAAWVRDPEAEFMCKPGKLAELAKTTPSQNRWAKAHYRAEKATHVPEVEAEPEKPKGERIPRETFEALMAEFQATMAEKDHFAKMKAKNHRPPPCARVDNTGVSEEMRQLLARQEQQR